jgi:hypothetical protein
MVATMTETKPNVVRVSKGHSVVLHILFGWLALWIPTVYYAVSPNHHYHL